MKLFGKSETNDGKGMYSISISSEGFCIAETSFSIGEKPELDICEYSLWEKVGPDDKQVKEKIKELGLVNHKCITILDIDDYAFLNVEAPEVPEEEVVSAVRWQISDMVEFDLADAVINVFESSISGGGDKPDNIYVVAAPSNKVKERTDFLLNAQANLDVIDIPEMVLRNLASLLPENEEGTAFLYMMERSGLILLVRDSYVYMARRLGVGLADIRAIAESSEPSGSDPLQGPVIQETNSELEALVLEILRSIDYYDRYFSLTPLSGLVITPMETELPGFQQVLAKLLGINVRYLDFNELLDCKNPVSKATQEHGLFAIGASLRAYLEQQQDEPELDQEQNLEAEG